MRAKYETIDEHVGASQSRWRQASKISNFVVDTIEIFRNGIFFRALSLFFSCSFKEKKILVDKFDENLKGSCILDKIIFHLQSSWSEIEKEISGRRRFLYISSSADTHHFFPSSRLSRSVLSTCMDLDRWIYTKLLLILIIITRWNIYPLRDSSFHLFKSLNKRKVGRLVFVLLFVNRLDPESSRCVKTKKNVSTVLPCPSL